MPTVYITTPPDAADEIADGLVERRHAACVNVVDCHSVYRWEDDVVHDDEAILLAKTTDDAYQELVEFVREAHPYDVPCIERFDEADVDPAFGEWIDESVQQ